jgi:hypothetical protein
MDFAGFGRGTGCSRNGRVPKVHQVDFSETKRRLSFVNGDVNRFAVNVNGLAC